jgi:uncharacterized protein YoxC
MEKSEVFNASKVVEDYSSSVEELEKITTEITKTASDGRPISEELRSKLNKELDGLKTHYTNLCEKAHKISKDIPENPSIYDLQKIIEEYDKISSELSEIKEILTKFIRVTSNDNEYKEALRPFQNKAREIIEKINNKTADKKIVSSEICKGAGCFIEALNVPPYKNINKETRHSLQNIFDTTVISGLAAGEYFDPQISTENEQSKPAQEPDAEPEQAQTEEPNAIDETPEDNTTAEETNENSDNSENQQNQNTIEHKAREMNLNGQLSMPESHIFELITPSVENFLMILSYIQIITPRQALGFCKNSRRFTSEKLNLRDMKKWFGEWSKKGFLSAITLPTEKEKVFCLPTNPLAGKNITPEIEKNIIFQLKKIDSHFHLFEKPKPISEPETISPEVKPEEPIKQIVQEEPAKQEELIEEIHAEQIPETEPEQKQEQEPEKPEETVKPEELEEPEKAEQIAETKEPEEIDEAENQEKDHLTTICELINSDKIYCATAYAKATNSPFYEALAYAVDDPDDPKAERDYLSTNIQELNKITEERDFIEPLILAAAIRTFFSGRNTYDDYSLPSLYSTIQGSDFETADKNPKLKDVIFKLFTFKNEHRKGMDCYVSQDTEYFDKKFNELKKETSQFIDLIEKSPVKIYDPKFLETKKLLFDNKGELIKFLELTKESKDKKLQQEISGFLKGNFIKEESNISHGNIDNQKIRKYIDLFWEKAKTNRALTGDPLTILTNELKRCITILINWINLIDEMPTESDKGTSDYKNSRKSMISDLEAAKEEINKSIDQHGNNIKKQAGLKIVEYTVEEIKNCIDNNRSIEDSKKYFYIDFLKTPDILLDEKYIPNFDSFPSDPVSLLPENRILQHCKNVANDSPVGKRLENIADDYGSAELILRYLQDINLEPENIDSIQKCINTGKRNAKKAAEEKKEDFTGELELAFAYGQLDISTEDEILNAVNNYSEKYMKDNNYGFFDRVLKSYREDIKAKAEIRKTVITEQLETFKEKIYEMSVEDQNKIINQIEDFIRQGNYTVVESLFANPKIILEDNENLSNEDFLKTFIDNYKTYHEPIAKDEIFGIIVKPFVTKRENSKDILEMAQCWFPSVADDNIGEKKLKTLLEHLGFNEINLERIETEAGKAGKPIYESYTVKSKKYTIFLHPIAALGSEMMSKDIRIVCIRKTLNADQIMDTITQISKDKQHTVILLDCALSLTDRRRLAKRSKAELGNKLFAVIDRTVMMFMCMHYDNTKMNRMLMALIMPFTYYQPYACNSENPIPPEMFIGRKEELDLIKAPNRVHIVYGGRQLGKSALLARAAWDINNNEKGGKAVLITIKNDDYKEAAKKIYKELINSKILLENSVKDPCDWKELADAIKHKLNNSKEISYLLLLLDEADKFIRTCEDVNFAPLDALADIQKTGKFKFVIAGLRDIVKFNRERVIGGNTIIAHLESMTVKPFTASEAKELLEIPLRYLGLRFPKGQEYLIYLILANTNYFPGLIQMYCAKLLEAMKKEKYAGYKEAATPPYEISKEHIKKALSDKDFKVEIFKKFEITLGLTDDDNEYYYIIARIIAYLHHERNNSSGYSPKDIIECGKDLEINKIAEMEPQQLEALLEELTELNILNATDNHYMFTRYNFFQMLGKKSDIGNKLYEYIGK